jgi:hypothetical protein
MRGELNWGELDWSEKINYAVGMLTLSLGRGDFRQTVTDILVTESDDAYRRGVEDGRRIQADVVAGVVVEDE